MRRHGVPVAELLMSNENRGVAVDADDAVAQRSGLMRRHISPHRKKRGLDRHDGFGPARDDGGEADDDAHSCTPRVRAPSTTRLVPVTKLAAGLARKTAALAISCGVPIRPVGLRASAVL